MKELKIPVIFENGKQVGYGGNQDWFFDEWAQKAGCASVLASNLYAYYHQNDNYEKAGFISIMDTMFSLMKPGKMGYLFLYKFARTFVKRMKDDSVFLYPLYQKKSNSYEHALSFVVESIDENHPVCMLILYHHAKALKDDNWHWICLSGYQEKEKGYEIIFSDCGIRRVIDASVLFDIDHHNIYKLVRMKRKDGVV